MTVRLLPRTIALRMFESGTRRTFVDAAIGLQELQHRGGEVWHFAQLGEWLARAHTEFPFEPTASAGEF